MDKQIDEESLDKSSKHHPCDDIYFYSHCFMGFDHFILSTFFNRAGLSKTLIQNFSGWKVSLLSICNFFYNNLPISITALVNTSSG